MSVERKLAAVMFTDIVGFTKIMTNSEDTAISILKAQDDIFNPLLGLQFIISNPIISQFCDIL